MPKEYKKLKMPLASLITAAVMIAGACAGLALNRSMKFIYLMAVVIIAGVFILFFASFENGRPSARELMVLASMSALAVASRAAFYALPQIKPMCAVIIITAACFGPQPGFLVGVVSMFASNFIFGQGIWTPFQMLGMGAVGLASGLIFYKTEARTSGFLLTLIGGMLCFALYGAIVDLSSVFMMLTEFNVKKIIAVYASGMAFNLTHAITTAVMMLITGKPLIKKLDRIKNKYGLFV